MTAGASTSAAGSSSRTRDPKSQPWIEKYRPKTLDDVASNKDIIDTIKRLTDENRLPHLLLYGPPGACCALPERTRSRLCAYSTKPSCKLIVYGKAVQGRLTGLRGCFPWLSI